MVQQNSSPRELARVVLVVDDNDTVRRSTGRVLAGAGYEVVEVATGLQAIDAVRTRRLDAGRSRHSAPGHRRVRGLRDDQRTVER